MPDRSHADNDLDALVDGVRRHDPDAWEALYRRMHPGLYGYACRRLPNRAAAEDAVSETMTRAMAGIDGFVPRGGGMPAWLFGILRNVVLEQHRAHGRAVPTEIADGPGDDPLPGDRMVELEQQRAVREAFSSLDPDDREVLELRVVAGLTGAATGEVLGMSAGAVRMAQMRALGKLRVHLREESDVD